ncbi:oncostatin-M-specific receptor subunit beta isoform X2 [Mugil cephalus]|uniref:oncostatin-M-specific receptor subunit beta isoform X2 n=1 Tax=Mugil cephalus TaxID=48193 RepID=UPI001FB8056C|nr:oncostatin-M-specific receptor subunit beta isoform X2 [Mugil cephalus]
MNDFRLSIHTLLGLCIIFSMVHGECYTDAGCQLPKPSISQLKALGDKRSLTVSWLAVHSGLVGDIYEIQISRTEKHTIIYSTNVSVPSVDSSEYTWTWVSDLPLECVDHSVRIRAFYNHSVAGPWSNWKTNNGSKKNDQPMIFPFEQVLMEGTTATFCCVPPAGVNITSIAFRNEPYALTSVGAGVKAITVNNLSIPTEDSMTVFQKKALSVLLLECVAADKKSFIWNYVSFPPQKLTNLSCATTDMRTVTCTWDSGRKRDRHDHNKRTYTLHIENSDRGPVSCEESSCTFPAVPQLQEYNISVVVKDMLGEETASHSFNISERVFPVVEWEALRAGVTGANMSWSVQGNFTRQNLLCQTHTEPGNNTELSCNSLSGVCEVKLEQLLPNTHYSTRVRCSLNGRLWGGWSDPVPFITLPLVKLDLWRRIEQLSDPHSRQVTLLWNPHIVGTAATLKIPGYKVQYTQEGRTNSTEVGQSQAVVSVGPGKCVFTVRAVLQSGSSVPARITVPPVDYTEKPPVQKRLSSTAAGGFNLSWHESSTVSCGYTVEWCDLRNAGPCTLKWVNVPEGDNTLVLPAGDFKAGCRYTFNIYGCTENGHTLLEKQTGYSKELNSIQSLKLVQPVQSTSSSVTLEWLYDEDDQPAFITGYLVTVQEVASNIVPGQAAVVFNKTVAEPRKKSQIIKGLQSNREYVCSVRALTKEGPGTPIIITLRTTINYSAYLAKILIPTVLVLGCIILLWPQRNTLKSGLKEIFVYPADWSEAAVSGGRGLRHLRHRGCE